MKKSIIVVGNGFASLFFIQYFLSSPVFPFFASFFRRYFSRYDITVIGDGKFVYFPAIPDYIPGTKTVKNITVDIRPYLKRRNIRFVDGPVIDIQDKGHKVITKNKTYACDALFVGVGPAFQKDEIPGTKEHTFSPCDGPEAMEAFLEKLDSLDGGVICLGFKVNKKDGFVSGRGGQMYECACLLDYSLIRRGVRDKFELRFFSAALQPDDKGPITERLLERDIVLDYGFAPVEFTAGGMIGSDGSFHKADLVLYSPGIIAPPLVGKSCLPASGGGLVDVDEFGQVKGFGNVFSAGDCASHQNPPPWVPHQAHMAQLRSSAAAKNMKAVLIGKSPEHTYRYELSCILNMGNDAIWLHRSEDDKPPFWNIFPKRSARLIQLKNAFESLYMFYLRHF